MQIYTYNRKPLERESIYIFSLKSVYFVLKGLTQSQNKAYTFQTKYIYTFPFQWFPIGCSHKFVGTDYYV